MGMPRYVGLAIAGLAWLSLGSAPAQAAASEWVGDAHAAARLITAVAATGSWARLDAGVQIRLAPGWHTYWRTPGDAGIPATLDWTGSDNASSFEVAWPAPVRFAVSGLETQGYENAVVLPVSVTLPRPGLPARFHLRLDYAACSNVCVPYHADLQLDLSSGVAVPDGESGLIADARSLVPVDPATLGMRVRAVSVADRGGSAELAITLDGHLPRGPLDVFVEGLPSGSAGHAVGDNVSAKELILRVPISSTHAAGLAGAPLDLTLVSGARSATFSARPLLIQEMPGARQSLPAIFGLALLGGLILNLMPCVLPVLGLKLLALARIADTSSKREARVALLVTAAGVGASFFILGAAVIGLRAAGLAVGWGIQFQQPWFLAGMAAATTLFAANLWGWLAMDLPASAVSRVATVRSSRKHADAFLSGGFATLLATSCSAPFLGTAVGFALSGSASDVVLVFGGLGLGMAIPLLAGALWPGFARWLPRPGPWMDWLRRALGLALLGTAAWLVVVLGVVAGPDTALTVGGILAVLLVMLAWRRRDSRGWSSRITWGAVAGFMALTLLSVTIASGQGEAKIEQARTGPWQDFDLARIGPAVSVGKVVMVDVSAAWCLTCKLNEATVLSRSPVRDRLQAPGVVAMRADWSKPDPAIATYLKSFGRFGVPMDVVYGPGAPGGIVLPELLTPSAVTDALDRAAAST